MNIQTEKVTEKSQLEENIEKVTEKSQLEGNIEKVTEKVESHFVKLLRIDKPLERCWRIRPLRVVESQDFIRRCIRRSIRKRLAVLVNRLRLDCDEQILEEYLRRIRIGLGRRRPGLRRSGRHCGAEQSCREQNSRERCGHARPRGRPSADCATSAHIFGRRA